MHRLEMITGGGPVAAGQEHHGTNPALLQFGPDLGQGLVFPQHELARMLSAQGVESHPLGGGDRFIGFPVDTVQIPVVFARQVTTNRMRRQERLPGQPCRKLPQLAVERLRVTAKGLAALAKAVELAQTKLPQLGRDNLEQDWVDWLVAHILLREAQGLVNRERGTTATGAADAPEQSKSK